MFKFAEMPFIVPIVIALIGFFHNSLRAQSAQDSSQSKEVIAIVLSKQIFLNQLLPPPPIKLEKKRQELSRTDFDKWLLETQARALSGLIQNSLFVEYSKENNLEPTDKEIEDPMKKIDKEIEGLTKRIGSDSVLHSENVVKRRKEFFVHMIRMWKVNGSLHRKYGGKVNLSNLGFHVPVYAVKKFLEEKEKGGAFEILDVKLREAFWAAVSDENWGDAIISEEKGKKMFETPPWIKEEENPEEKPEEIPEEKPIESKVIVIGDDDEPPMPIGGFDAIQRNLKYPEAARSAGIEGIIFVEVTVDTTGNVAKTKIVKSINRDCDEAAIAAVRSVKWKPAKTKGIPVEVQIMVPVKFRLR
jgi:TonB family protein